MLYLTRKFWNYAIERAVKTFFQAALAAVAGSAALSIADVGVKEVAGVALLAALISLLTSLSHDFEDAGDAVTDVVHPFDAEGNEEEDAEPSTLVREVGYTLKNDATTNDRDGV